MGEEASKRYLVIALGLIPGFDLLKGVYELGIEAKSLDNKGVFRSCLESESGNDKVAGRDRTGRRAVLVLYCVVCDANHLPCFHMKSSVKRPVWLMCPGAGGSPETLGNTRAPAILRTSATSGFQLEIL